MTKYVKGDYTSCYTSICEIWEQTDEDDEELYATVRLEDADKIIDCLNENEQLKSNIDIRDKGIIELKEENEKLKQQLHDCRIYNGKLYANNVKKDKPIVKDLIKITKENEVLKSQLKYARNFVYKHNNREVNTRFFNELRKIGDDVE